MNEITWLRRLILGPDNNPVTAAQRLTLLTLVLYGGDYWQIRIPVVAVCAVGVLAPALLDHRAFWAILATVFAAGMWPQLLYLDNHKYLMLYWLITLAHDSRPRFIQRQAAVMIGLVFMFAVIWKIRTPEFLNGSFMTCSLLTDQRFAGFASVALELSKEDLAENSKAIARLGIGAAEAVRLRSNAMVDSTGLVMTYWALLTEAAVAYSFLRPSAKYRDLLLILFIGATYALANVPGFAWMLCILGFVASYPTKAAPVYFCLFLLTQFYRAPWAMILSG